MPSCSYSLFRSSLIVGQIFECFNPFYFNLCSYVFWTTSWIASVMFGIYSFRKIGRRFSSDTNDINPADRSSHAAAALYEVTNCKSDIHYDGGYKWIFRSIVDIPNLRWVRVPNLSIFKELIRSDSHFRILEYLSRSNYWWILTPFSAQMGSKAVSRISYLFQMMEDRIATNTIDEQKCRDKT